MSWTSHRVVIAVPATERGMARFLWRFLDPDRGGEQTFDKPNWTRGGLPWLVCCTQLETPIADGLEHERHDEVEREVRKRDRRRKRGEKLPDRTEVAALRSQMFIRRVPDGQNPRAILQAAGFVEMPRGPGP